MSFADVRSVVESKVFTTYQNLGSACRGDV